MMVEQPGHWAKYYHGSENEKAFKRKYSLSDRIRYYWAHPLVQEAFNKMLKVLNQIPIPATVLHQYVPDICANNEDEWKTISPEQVLLAKVKSVLDDYVQACNP